MEKFVNNLVTTFHHVIREESGNDVTVARAKTMIALASLTWPDIGLEVAAHHINPRRMIWKSKAFESVAMGGAFRRDPVGDDASIIIDEDQPKELVMYDEMEACAAFIPLFGRQRLERFNLTLAQLFRYRDEAKPLPAPGSPESRSFYDPEEYERLHEWLQRFGTITGDGAWHHQAPRQLSA